MLNRFLALTMMVVFLMGSFTKSLLFLDYELRQDYFASTLCEKKDVVNNLCHGMCHLKKEIREQDDRENKQGNNPQVKSEVNAIAVSMVEILVLDHVEEFRFPAYLESESAFCLMMDLRPPIV
ncbi:MAG: hypothetical protein IPJ26_16845 [Bacteroidetes bacterium]|nr:hypothetical protein [Bacteroidota bacterium]